jgi:transketolase
MRAAFVAALIEAASADDRVMLLTGDLGYTVIEPFAERFPHRFLNVGVAEQDLVGLATGLSEAGFRPFVYSIATFMSLRPYEFIRNGPVQHGLPVRLVAVGGGFEYGTAGHSHHALEDLGLMRMLPGLTVVAPADHRQALTAIRATWDLPGPVYYRLGKDDRTEVAGLEGRFRLGSAEALVEGPDLLFVGLGSIVFEMVGASEILVGRGIRSTVVVLSSFNPGAVDDVARQLARHSVAITVEEHSVVGGLGSFVGEIIAERGLNCRLVRCGVRAVPDGRSGGTAWLRERHGLSAARIATTAMTALDLPS